MSIYKKYLFTGLIFVYILAFIVFWGKLWLDLERKPQVTGQSSVPSMSLGLLNKISTQLDKRTKLESTEKIDLGKFNFGKIEPFN